MSTSIILLSINEESYPRFLFIMKKRTYMTKIPFSQLGLTPKVEKAIGEMGFELATPIQSEAIPLIRSGADVIARSQTGTGKTIAFGIPAIEKVDTHEEKQTIQVLILCPTRELAQQAAEEIRKLTRFKTGIRPVEVFGGASIEKQCIRLRSANMVIGTPGRVMDHMRRKTLKLNNLKMVVLDEADEMLNMGFKEDIETILLGTPEDRQTVLFSATMPPAIMALTKQFQKDPKLIEIDKGQVTIADIEQKYIDVPHDRKKDALFALIQYHQPSRAIIFCNTKKMVDELTEMLCSKHISAVSIHSDIKQDQRTAVMQGFKRGKTSILIATDIAARGIDVSDVDFVINYDIPPNTEYYIHRIGRTGRAGKSGVSITLCSGKREIAAMRGIAFQTKSEIKCAKLPSTTDIQKVNDNKALSEMEAALKSEVLPSFLEMADQLTEQGYDMKSIAAAAMQMLFKTEAIKEIIPSFDQSFDKSYDRRRPEVAANFKPRTDSPRQKADGPRPRVTEFETILINIGSSSNAAANHIMGALTERTNLAGNEIGKIEVYEEQSVVEIPSGRGNEIVEAMKGSKICGRTVFATRLTEAYKKRRSEPRKAPEFHKGWANKRPRKSSF